MSVEKISKAEYDSYNPARGGATSSGEELEWYKTTSENVIGMVVRDKADDDYLYVVQGPDQNGSFRAVDLEVSIADRSEARDKLFESLNEYEQSGKEVFPQ